MGTATTGSPNPFLDTDNWAICSDDILVKNPEFVFVEIDENGKALACRKPDGTKIEFCDLEIKGNIINPFVEKTENTLSFFDTMDNPEWIKVIVDNGGKVIEGIDKNGIKKYGIIPPQFEEEIQKYIHDYSKFPIDFGTPNVSNSWLVVGDGNEGGRHSYCIAVGKNVLTDNTGIKNITVGYDNMHECTGHDNTSMGYHAMFRSTSGNANAGFGSESLDDNTIGSSNTGIGFCALQRNNAGSNNVAVGNCALRGGKEGTRYDPENLKSFNRNTCIGAITLDKSLSGTNDNIAVGYNVMSSEKVYTNNIAIGNNTDCDKDNQTVIGNSSTIETIVRGNLIVMGTDGNKRQIVFNNDNTCSWVLVED